MTGSILRCAAFTVLAGYTLGCGAAPAPRPSAAPAPVVVAEPESRPDIFVDHPLVGHARAVVEAFNRERCDSLRSRFDERMNEALPGSKLSTFCAAVRSRSGPITSWRILDLKRSEGTFELTGERDGIFMRLHRRGEGEVLSGLFMRPPPPPAPAVAAATMAWLPVAAPDAGRWLVVHGGPDPEGNHHLGNHQQRRAVDLVIIDEDGKSHRAAGSANEDYFAYGQPVLAAAAGTVHTVVRGVPDNAPGGGNGYFVFGNVVVIEHATDVFSVYAHLAPDSILVAVGDVVEAGTPLGQIGNTGRSTEPHLHFHLQSKGSLHKGWGVDPHFPRVERWREGTWTAAPDYTFDKGDVIRPARP